jgi:hypothetical protein
LKLGQVKEALEPTLEVPIATVLINNDTTIGAPNFLNVYYFLEITKHVIIKVWIENFP